MQWLVYTLTFHVCSTTTENRAVARVSALRLYLLQWIWISCLMYFYNSQRPAASPVSAMQALHLKERMWLEVTAEVSNSFLLKSNQCNAFPWQIEVTHLQVQLFRTKSRTNPKKHQVHKHMINMRTKTTKNRKTKANIRTKNIKTKKHQDQDQDVVNSRFRRRSRPLLPRSSGHQHIPSLAATCAPDSWKQLWLRNRHQNVIDKKI